MAWDYFKVRGRAKASKPDAGGGVIRSEPVFGIVKDNIDPVRAGRLQVYIADFGASDPNDSESWVTVSYMSPFYGVTAGTGGSGKAEYGSYTQNPVSYGIWNSPPDIGTMVICIFINGDMNYGFYIGSVPEPEALQMVPAIGAVENIVANAGEAESYGGATQLPVTNLNENNSKEANGVGFLESPKPVHSYAAHIYEQQGLIRDTLRGPITTSAQRESPSRVGWGVSSPGRPIYEGGYTDETIASTANKKQDTTNIIGRRSGHSIIMDDGDLIGRDQLIRLRTSLGHQILMSDDGQCLHIIHSNGQSWIEMGKEGTIDMYATNSVNIRTQGDLNLHADNNINLNAAKELNIAADSININTTKDISFRIGANFNTYTTGKFTMKSGGAMSMSAGGEASYSSTNITYINGSKVNLNSGSSSVVPAEVAPIAIIAHTDTLLDDKKGYAAAPGKLLSIVSRAPAHAPWANANQGVDVKTNSSASKQLPAAPSAALASANKTAATAPTTPVTVAVASTAPAPTAISPALDKTVTATMVAAVSTAAATTAASVVSTGTGLITTATGATEVAVGVMAQTVTSMENSGCLKPGAAPLINRLVNAGQTVAQAMTPNLFTGKDGINSLPAFVSDISAQVSSQVANFQTAQSQLTTMGVLSGNQAPSQMAGAVMAAATQGAQATADFVKSAAGGNIPTGLTGAAGGVASAMASGNFAASLATNVMGGLGSIATSLSGIGKSLGGGITGLLDSVKGVAGSAFAAITSAFKPLAAGVPQDLRVIAEKNAAEAAALEAGAASGVPTVAGAMGLIKGAVGGLTGSLTGAVGKLTSAAAGGLPIAGIPTVASSLGVITGAGSNLIGQVTGSISKLTGAVTNLTQSFSGTASGASALPGGLGSMASIVSTATGALNSIPGVASITGLIKNTSTSVMNGISAATSLLSPGAALSTGPLGSALSTITSAASKAFPGVSDLLSSGKDKLTSLVLSGLPASAAAKLNASINALSSGGPVPVKLPTVAEKTNEDRDVLGDLAKSKLDPKVPLPNFGGGVTTVAKESVKDSSSRLQAIIKLRAEGREQSIAVASARRNFLSAQQSLPQGSPEVEELKAAYAAEVAKSTEIADKLSAL